MEVFDRSTSIRAPFICASLIAAMILGMATAQASYAGSAAASSAGCNGRVDVATANLEELMTLPGINRGIAKRLLNDRLQRPFASADDMVVRGTLSKATLVEMLSADPCVSTGRNPRGDYHDLLECTAPSELDINTATSDQLAARLPGVRDVAELIKARPLAVDLRAVSPHSHAATRALAVGFANDRLCLSDGPFPTAADGQMIWVNPGDAFALKSADRILSGAAGAVDDSCWATISEISPSQAGAIPEKPSPLPDAPELPSERFGDYHMACQIVTEVDVSLIDAELVGANPGMIVYILHHGVAGWEGLTTSSIDPATGRVTFATDSLSPFGALGRKRQPSLKQAEAELCFGNPFNANFARCYWTDRDIRPWVDAVVDKYYGAGASTTQDGTRANAFKHCVLMAQVTHAYGASFAKALGDAHESGDATLDAQMDLKNNAVGRDFGGSSGYVAACLSASKNGGLWHIVNGQLVSTAPTPPPPPSGGLSVTFTENPFTCDGGPSRTFGRVSGARPGETVTFFSPQLGTLLPGIADGSGSLSIIWQCAPSDAGSTWTVTGTGQSSGATVTFTVRGI